MPHRRPEGRGPRQAAGAFRPRDRHARPLCDHRLQRSRRRQRLRRHHLDRAARQDPTASISPSANSSRARPSCGSWSATSTARRAQSAIRSLPTRPAFRTRQESNKHLVTPNDSRYDAPRRNEPAGRSAAMRWSPAFRRNSRLKPELQRKPPNLSRRLPPRRNEEDHADCTSGQKHPRPRLGHDGEHKIVALNGEACGKAVDRAVGVSA